jgi:hypothetical protein
MYDSGSIPCRGWDFFFFIAASGPALGHTERPVQWVSGAVSPDVKRPRREADHSPASTAEVKNAWSYTSTPPYVFMAWYLVKYGNSSTLTLGLS